MRLGIEIKPHHVLAALIKRRGAHWKLLGLFKKPAANGLSEIKKQLPKFGVKTIVGIPRKDIAFKEIPLDRNLRSEEIAFYLQKNIPKLFPEVSKEFYFDFEILANPSKHNQARVVVAEKQTVQAFLEPIRKQGFKVLAVDVDELAKNRGFSSRESLSDPEFLTALGLALWEPSNEH